MPKGPRPRNQTAGRTAPSSQVLPLAWRVGLIVLAGTLAYSNTFSNPFILDDLGMFTVNPQLGRLGNLHEFFALTPGESPMAGRPLPNLLFALNYAVRGTNVWGYHAVNLALHLCCALLAFGLIRRTLELPGIPHVLSRSSANLALAVSLLWTVHPLNSEVVDYLVQRTESMMALCYLATFYASLRGVMSARHSTGWSGLALLACTAGMACKESMITAPVMLLLFDRTFLFGSTTEMFRRRGVFYAGLAAAWSLLVWLIVSNPRHSSTGFSALHVSPWTYLMNQVVMVTRYLRLSVWPRDLVVFYGWARPLGLGDVWLPAVVLMLLLAGTLWLYRRAPRLGFAAAWFWVTLSPASSIVPLAGEVGAERRMYLPLLGLIAVVLIGGVLLSRRAWLAIDDAHRLQRRSADRTALRGASADQSSVRPAYGLAIVVSISGLLMLGTLSRNREYADGLTMAWTVLERWPTPIAHNMVGTELAGASRQGEAIAHLREAATAYPPARYNLGAVLLGQGDVAEGTEQLRQFIRENPSNFLVRQARIAIGRVFEGKRDWPHAVETYQALLDGSSGDIEAHGLLAEALAGQERFAEAIPHYEAFLDRQASNSGAWTGLGIARMSTDQVDAGIRAFRTALALLPDNSQYRRNLATALLARGDVAEAAEQAGQALTLTPNDSATHELMGRVRMSQGSTDAARREFEEAVRLDPGNSLARQELAVAARRR